MNKLKIFFILLVLTIIGCFLRFYNLETNPPSLNIDEVAYGYSAYSILKTGKDENGQFMPFVFRSIGDYKNPILIYSLVPSIAVFGLNEFGVRFPTALAGALSIPIFFFLLQALTKDIRISLIGTVLLTTSPWHIFYSRFASDHLMSTFFLILGMFAFVKIEQSKWWILSSAGILVLSMYTYHSQRIFIPIFILTILFFSRNKQSLNFSLRSKYKLRQSNIKLFSVSFFLLVLPVFFLSIFGPANTRAKMVFLTQDIDYTRYVVLDHAERFGEFFLLFFFWIKRYLNYFQPDFLFFNGLNMTTSGTLGLGVLHFFELPLLILGIFELIRRKMNCKNIIIAWILVGLIPTSVTNNEQNSGRSLLILPALIVVLSLGALRFWEITKKLSNRYLKLSILSVYALLIVIFLIHAFLVFHIYFPIQRGEAYMEGTRETVLYALQNKNKYSEIVYDPYRGVEAPYIVNIPYMYILFYSKYDPTLFQNEVRRYGDDLFGFDKFTIRRIDWRVDRAKERVLFIGSPWSLPLKDLKDEEILKKIYLSNGDLALLVVSPKEVLE